MVDARKIEVSWIKDTLQYKEINYKNSLKTSVNKSDNTKVVDLTVPFIDLTI